MTLIAAIVVSLAVGAVAGFLIRRRTTVWCTTCGSDLKCIPCTVKAGQATQRGDAQRPTGCR